MTHHACKKTHTHSRTCACMHIQQTTQTYAYANTTHTLPTYAITCAYSPTYVTGGLQHLVRQNATVGLRRLHAPAHQAYSLRTQCSRGTPAGISSYTYLIVFVFDRIRIRVHLYSCAFVFVCICIRVHLLMRASSVCPYLYARSCLVVFSFSLLLLFFNESWMCACRW